LAQSRKRWVMKTSEQDEIIFYPVMNTDLFPSGERVFIEVGGRQIVLVNLGGEYYAFGDVCTHDDSPLGDGDIEGYEIICPRHGARFDVRNGKALCLPAIRDIPSYPVRVVEGTIQVGIKE
jgi:3-phenylpropionate/trans-cinnamate dioxygenase ferredoxin subunit